MRLGRVIAALGFVLGVSAPGLAATCNATTNTEIQDCINAAAAGDTVSILGTISITTQITITNKALTLTGPTCTLSDTTPPITVPLCSAVLVGNVGAAPIINITTCSAANFVTLAHFTLQLVAAGSGSGMIHVGCSAAGGAPPVVFRIHHVQFDGDATNGTTNNSNGPRWFTANGTFGLLDHCQFLAQTTRGMGNVSADKDNAPSTVYLYHHPFSFGDTNGVYVEDSFFYSTTAGQGNGATDNYISRAVVRMSTIYNNNVGNHGFDSQNRGFPTFELYGNTFLAGSGVGNINLFQPRSGTGFVWGNTVENLTGVSNGYVGFHKPQYYGGANSAETATVGGLWYAARAGNGMYYPSGAWTSYNGVTNFGGSHNYVGYGSCQTFDGNQSGVDSMDADYTRTVTDLNTTNGSTTITSASANFVSGAATTLNADASKFIAGVTNFKRGRISSCVSTASNTTLECSGESFDAGDVGRHLSFHDRTTIGGSSTSRIKSVTDATHVVLEAAPSASGTKLVLFSEPFILSVTNSTTAVMNVPATGTTTTGTLTLGYTNQCYPLLDQPGRGYFSTANAGGWPKAASYTDADYEAVMPIYLFGNQWRGTPGGSWANPPATTPSWVSSSGYLKADREWYDPAGGIQTSSASPFDGTTGTGIGTAANRPATCTAGVGYWALDEGSWNTSGTWTYTYPNGGSSYAQGRFYKCTATDTWTLYYTPLTYPHPLNTDSGAVTITTGSLPGGTVGVSYSATVEAAGGTAPYVFTVQSGSVPAGLTLSSAGVLSGTPTTAATYNFTVLVTDDVSATDTQVYEVTISASLTVSQTPNSFMRRVR